MTYRLDSPTKDTNPLPSPLADRDREGTAHQTTNESPIMLATSQVVVTSYGARWSDPPRHDGPVLKPDVSGTLWNPAAHAITQGLVPLTGLDPAVRDHALATPGAAGLIEGAGCDVPAVREGRAEGGPVHLDVHCWHGRHRAPAVAEAVGAWLRGYGVDAAEERRATSATFTQRTRPRGA